MITIEEIPISNSKVQIKMKRSKQEVILSYFRVPGVYITIILLVASYIVGLNIYFMRGNFNENRLMNLIIIFGYFILVPAIIILNSNSTKYTNLGAYIIEVKKEEKVIVNEMGWSAPFNKDSKVQIHNNKIYLTTPVIHNNRNETAGFEILFWYTKYHNPNDVFTQNVISLLENHIKESK